MLGAADQHSPQPPQLNRPDVQIGGGDALAMAAGLMLQQPVIGIAVRIRADHAPAPVRGGLLQLFQMTDIAVIAVAARHRSFRRQFCDPPPLQPRLVAARQFVDCIVPMCLIADLEHEASLGGIAALLCHLAATAGGLGAAQRIDLMRGVCAAGAGTRERHETWSRIRRSIRYPLRLAIACHAAGIAALLIRPVGCGDVTRLAGEVERLFVIDIGHGGHPLQTG